MNFNEKTVAEVKKNYKYSHTALTRGYVSVKTDGIVEPYEGRYGKGYTILTHNGGSTQYCCKSYYLEEKNNLKR